MFAYYYVAIFVECNVLYCMHFYEEVKIIRCTFYSICIDYKTIFIK